VTICGSQGVIRQKGQVPPPEIEAEMNNHGVPENNPNTLYRAHKGKINLLLSGWEGVSAVNGASMRF